MGKIILVLLCIFFTNSSYSYGLDNDTQFDKTKILKGHD